MVLTGAHMVVNVDTEDGSVELSSDDAVYIRTKEQMDELIADLRFAAEKLGWKA